MSSTLTVKQDVYRRLMAGETLTGSQVADDYGVSAGYLSQVLVGARADGETVLSELVDKPGGPKRHRLDVTPREAQWGKGPNVKAAAAIGPRQPKSVDEPQPKAPAQPRKPKSRLPHPVPALGADLTVEALSLTKDNTVAISLTTDEGSWLVEVIAYSRPRSDDG